MVVDKPPVIVDSCAPRVRHRPPIRVVNGTDRKSYGTITLFYIPVLLSYETEMGFFKCLGNRIRRANNNSRHWNWCAWSIFLY